MMNYPGISGLVMSMHPGKKEMIKLIIKKVNDLKNNQPALLPPMPWPSIKHFSDDELKAIFAYLKSVKPISNAVPAYMPPAAN